MAISIKIKKKKPRVSKSVDQLKYGDEPIVVKDLTEAYNWYNYMYDAEKAKSWILEYMKKSGYTKNQIAMVKRAAKHKTSTTAGWLARISMNGNEIQSSSIEFLKSRIDQLIADGKETAVEVKEDKPVVDIQARVREKANFVITNIEEEIDLVMEGKNFSMYTYCQANELSAQILNIVKEYYQPQYDEIRSNDEQVKESFGKKLKFWINFWNEFFGDIDRYVNNKKAVKVRKPRQKKVKSAVDQVKNMKYKVEDPSLKIVSVHPGEIIGCTQLWTYNTKYKKLTRYDSSGPAGIGVKGTTLTGFDIEKSVSKSLRKPDIAIQSLLGAGKVNLRKFMDDIKTVESIPNGRINPDTILLRVIK